jgi:hypothetical protein
MLLSSLLLAAPVLAQDKTKDTARAVARTAADGVVDAGRTIGATAKGLVDGGKPAAKAAYHENAARGRSDMHEDAAKTRAAAHE